MNLHLLKYSGVLEVFTVTINMKEKEGKKEGRMERSKEGRKEEFLLCLFNENSVNLHVIKHYHIC